MVSRYSKKVITTFFFFISAVIVFNKFTTNEYKNNKSDEIIIVKSIIPNLNESVEKAQNCLNKKFRTLKDQPNYQWFVIDDVVTECVRGIRTNIPFIEAPPDHYERKYYMIPRIQYINDTCSVISFGVGGEIQSEKHIQMTLPHCSFLGFDPNKEYSHLFVDDLRGKFVQAAVAGVTGKNVILELGKAGYAEKSAVKKSVTSAAELIETHHGKENLIDILNIDIEGSEYSILQRLFVDNAYKNACQINFEIHPVWYHFTGYTYHDAMDIFSKIAEDGTFLWLKNFIHAKQFYCGFFINVKNKRCIEKYLKNRLY